MRNRWPFYVWLVLIFGFFGLFLIYPILYVMKGSVCWIDENGKMHVTLIFFQLFGENPLMWKCLFHSFLLAFLTTIFCAAIALPLAQLFVYYDFPLKRLWQVFLMGPLILPPFVGAIGIQQWLGRFGILNHFLGLVGSGVTYPHPVDWLGSSGIFGIVVMQSLHLFPILFLNLSTALANINPTMSETARCLGASSFRVFRTVTLPLLKPGFFAGAMIVFIWAFTDLGTPLIFGFEQVVAVQIFDKVTETGFNPFGYTLVIVVLLVTVVLFLWSRRWITRQDFVTHTQVNVGEEAKPLHGVSKIVVQLGLAIIFLAAFLPHATVILQSLSGKWFMEALPRTWTTKHYREVFTLLQTVTGLKNSLLYSSLSALIDVVLGSTIAYWLARKEFVGKAVLDTLTVLPLALPGIVLAFGYVVGFNVPAQWKGVDFTWLRNWINPRENPMLLLVVSYSIRRLPYVVRIMYSGLQQVSVLLEEASRSLGASQWLTLRRIVFPILKSNLFAGGVLAFAFAFLEVSDSLILAMKEQFYPVTKTIWALVGRIEPDAVHVACALGVLGMFLLLLSFYVVTRLLGKKMGSLFG